MNTILSVICRVGLLAVRVLVTAISALASRYVDVLQERLLAGVESTAA